MTRFVLRLSAIVRGNRGKRIVLSFLAHNYLVFDQLRLSSSSSFYSSVLGTSLLDFEQHGLARCFPVCMAAVAFDHLG